MRCAVLILLLFFASPLWAAKRALLVGVNDYIHLPPENRLKGCENDVMMTREVLNDKFDFPEENIKVLLNGDATAQNILKAIQDWLVTPVKPDDVVYFHFSGHGSQMYDLDHDEDDGRDELICPVDMEQGRLSSVITDDQLRQALDKIPARSITVVLDACHSGTGTRDLSLSRPRFVVFDTTLNNTRGLSLTIPAKIVKDKLAGSGGIEAESNRQITISGCRPDQISADAWIREGFYAGALTYHLVENMKKAPSDLSYRELMERVVRDIQAANFTQIPQVEGDMGQPLLGGKGEEEVAVPFVVVESVEGRRLRLKASEGLTTGSIYAVFPPGEKAFVGEGLGRIEIGKVDQAGAEAQLLGDFVVQSGGRARELVHGFAAEKLKIRVEDGDEGVCKALQQALAKLDFAEAVGPDQHFDHRLVVNATGSQWQAALTRDGVAGVPVLGENADSLVAGLRPQLENAYAFKFLAGLDNSAPPFKVEVWANRAEVEQAPDEKLVQAEVGELLRFNFRAERNCYLTLIDLGTSGKITVLFPNQYCPSGYIKGGETYRTGAKGDLPFQIRATGPAGRELVKVIATLDSLDLPSLRMGKAGGAGTRTIEAGSDFVHQLTRDLSVEGIAPEGQEALLPTDRWATDYVVVETSP